ncbi:hypothetical protein GALMADRAFT_61792 [Galerina marginata CBS 339.88]|uniref:Major facilitator superfamily (MFS) profile domain-containing protein n=1 Tax=Galerina marginata (strain CBS 339.88) TaxID=685588 RepID=A0A067TN95_GALM3|nr:hypothetical protein GALMADRAFT_61792 [Galerina marginata CBS 339.88]
MHPWCKPPFHPTVHTHLTTHPHIYSNGLNILPSYINYFNLTAATIGLNTSSLWIGGCIAGLTWGKVTDLMGRRPALFWAAVLTLIAVLLQTAAQNVAMFVIARILLGFGTSASGLTGPAYLAETLPLKWRAWGLGIFNDFYYVGGLIAAGITYATSFSSSTWAWRTPSAIQGAFSIICILIIPFIPESPRWLVFSGRTDEARVVLAQTCADGDEESPVVREQLREIEETFRYEREVGKTLSMVEVVRTPEARKRVLLAVSAAVFSQNIILNAFCLVCSIFGTYIIDVWGRKPTAVISTALLTIFLFMVGALTKVFGNSTNTSGIYGTVAAIFLFQGTYSIGWTPILYLYPPEVLNYSIRANGMGVFQFFLNATAILIVFTMPLALTKLAWKTYMINGAWNVVMLGLIMYYWVETKGKTLEAIDEAIDGVRHGGAGAGVETGSLGEKDRGEEGDHGECFWLW